MGAVSEAAKKPKCLARKHNVFGADLNQLDLFLNEKSGVLQAVFEAGNDGRSKSPKILAWPSKKDLSVVKIC